MFGVTITEGPEDWQILQQDKGRAVIHLKGSYQVPKAAIDQGVETAVPKIQIISAADGFPVLPWTRAVTLPDSTRYSGEWTASLSVPAGGPYHIQTMLQTKSTLPDISWNFRGDMRLHIGVGNLFVIAGQSNAAGSAWDSAFDPPALGVHLFRNRKQWSLAAHPFNESTFAPNIPNKEMGLSGSCPYLSFGKRFQQLSHLPVGLIATAYGGSSMSQWNPENKNGLYQNMLESISACGGNVAGILWYQGCSDATKEDAPLFYDRMEEFIATTRQDLGFRVPFFTFQLNRFTDGANPYWGVLREQQRQLSKTLPSVYILPTLHASLSDGIHNSAGANVTLGEQLARQVSAVLLGGTPFFAPEPKEVTYQEKTVTLTLSSVRESLVLASGRVEESGFLIKDSQGEVPLLKIRLQNQNQVLLTVERPLTGESSLSYAWEYSPKHALLFDRGTGLSLLSFYRYPVQYTNPSQQNLQEE